MQGSEVEEMALQHTLDRKRGTLEVVARQPEAKSWLAPCAGTEAGTDKLYAELERRIQRDDFAAVLADEQREHAEAESSGAAHPLSGSEVLQADWWQPKVENDITITEKTGDWVLVEHETTVDLLAEFLAAYIVALPEARNMQPKELQAALQTGLKELRKGRLRRLWDWGRYLYRAAALSYGAFTAYTNPWVAEAVVRGLFTFVRYARMFW